MKDSFSDVRVPISKDNVSIYRDEELCIKCGSCKNICKFNVKVYDNYDINKVDKPICINCGQCSLVCPKASIREVEDYLKVKEVMKESKVKIFQIAPAVRVALGEEFGVDLGKDISSKLVSALRFLGADYVFDTTFGADLTIMEEASELVDRIKNNGILPMFTSCCPAWVKYVETFYPEFIPNLSSCKSPIMMQGSIIKNYFGKLNNFAREDIVSIAIAPCTAKKYEISRSEFNNDVDYVITTREFAKWLKEENIDLMKLEDSSYDSVMATGSGAGIIFGSSGGVMESALRTCDYLLGGSSKERLTFEDLRGLRNIKEGIVKVGDRELRVAVINGTGDAKSVLDRIKNNEVSYDFIEVMACEGGCIAGGGQPRVHFPVGGEIKNKRSGSLFEIDKNSKVYNSYDNVEVKKLYSDFLIEPLSKESHHLLHTTYVNRENDLKRNT